MFQLYIAIGTDRSYFQGRYKTKEEAQQAREELVRSGELPRSINGKGKATVYIWSL